MCVRALDHEIRSVRSLGVDFRAYPRVSGVKGTVGQTFPILADGFVKQLTPGGVDGVIDLVDPFDIGAEFDLSAQIDGDVYTQSAQRVGHRIDQACERRFATPQSEINTTREILAGDAVGGNALDAARDRLRIKARRIDDMIAKKLHRFVTTDAQKNAVVANLTADDGAVEGDHRPMILGFALVGKHQAMAVDQSR